MTSPPHIAHRVPPPELALGLVVVEGLEVGPAPAALVAALEQQLAVRRERPLSADEERRRSACRDMLRRGRYKPTGRGKPASEYLLRAARDGQFPRVSGPVDALNLVSLAHLVPISLWDLDRAETDAFEVRPGRPEEQYVFNTAGQLLGLGDLVCGCGLRGERSLPMFSPVKDSLATKIQADTRRAAACVFCPLAAMSREQTAAVAAELLGWLRRCGAAVVGHSFTLAPGERSKE